VSVSFSRRLPLALRTDAASGGLGVTTF